MQSSFHEIQKFNKWWHYLIAGFPVILTGGIALLTSLNIIHSKNGENPSSFLMLPLGFTVLIFIWFVLLRLKTTINAEGIIVQFAGIPFCKRVIGWNDIKSISLITYSPLSDYGGWGVRYSMSGNGWCYNVSGDWGIKIIYENGKPFLIGTQQAEEAKKMIDHYFKIHS